MKILTRGILAAALLASLTARAQHDMGGMDIGVRSGIDRAEKHKRDRDRIYEKDLAKHAKVFLRRSVRCWAKSTLPRLRRSFPGSSRSKVSLPCSRGSNRRL